MDTHHPVTGIVELRQYLLHAGRRDELVDLFDTRFVETQEAAGMRVIGQFRDPDRPDHFVWLRGFPDMHARLASLTAFYEGPVWAANREAANATMIDSDDVLLLRPIDSHGRLLERDPATRDARTPSGGLAIVVVHRVQEARDEALERFARGLLPALECTGALTVGRYETEPSTNTFARLPVRRDTVLVWIGAFRTLAALEAGWPPLRAAVAAHADGPVPAKVHRLVPTSRSLLDGAD